MVSTGARATGAAQTLIHVQGTGRASKASEAGAGKGAHAVLAGTAIEARVCSEQEGSLVIPYGHVSLEEARFNLEGMLLLFVCLSLNQGLAT